MELVFRVCLFIAGAINFLPGFLAFLPDKFSDSYGIQIPDGNFELLMRHRAVLFGIVGGLMMWSALSKKSYGLAVLIGLVSMASFILLLKLSSGEINPQLIKIMWIDVAGIAILLIGCATYKFV